MRSGENMGRHLIDADVLREKLKEKVFKEYTDEFYGTMQVIDEMAQRENLNYRCRECQYFVEQRLNKRGTLLGKCEKKMHRPMGTGETYGSVVACVRFKRRMQHE